MCSVSSLCRAHQETLQHSGLVGWLLLTASLTQLLLWILQIFFFIGVALS